MMMIFIYIYTSYITNLILLCNSMIYVQQVYTVYILFKLYIFCYIVYIIFYFF